MPTVGFCSSARKAAILRHLPAGLGQAEEDILKALCLCSQSNHTHAAFGKGTDQCRQRFVRQRGQLQGVRLVCRCGGFYSLLLQDGCGFGCVQHPQQNAAPAVLCSCCKEPSNSSLPWFRMPT